MNGSCLNRRTRQFLIPGVFVLLAGSVSAQERGGWLGSLFDGTTAVAAEIQGDVTPSHVFRATKDLQTRLGMDASGVPSLTLVRVTPSEVFDSTNMLLAEMARIKFHLGVDEQPAERPEPTGKRPRDTFALVFGIIKNLDKISAGV